MSDFKRRSIWVFRIPGDSVELTTHGDVWDSSLDLDDLTAGWCDALGDSVDRGAWFFCPQYTVYSPTPSADFFRVVREARGQWLMQARKIMGRGAPRRETRRADRQGRRLAFLELERPSGDADGHTPPPEVIPLDQLSGCDREQVLLGGMLARGWAMTGVLFIDGLAVSPRDGNRMADALLNPADPANITTTHRHLDLAALKATGNPEPLRRVALSALRAHLADHPGHAAYVAPHLTLSAPSATPAFYRKAAQARDRWGILLKRTLGCGDARRLRRAVDPEAYALVFGGVLHADGRLYWLGCWPDRPPELKHLARSPHRAPTVPPEFFGLRPASLLAGPRISDPSPVRSRATCVEPDSLNVQFIGLFGAENPCCSAPEVSHLGRSYEAGPSDRPDGQ